MATIKSINAREILSAKGTPTIETTVVLENNITATASIGFSLQTTPYDMFTLRDKDSVHFKGQGVLKAVTSINTTINNKLSGIEASDQKTIDQALLSLDPSPTKTTIGGNAMITVSMACAKAGALSQNIPLYSHLASFLTPITQPFRIPIILSSLMNGGTIGNDVIDFRNIMIMPASSKTYIESLQIIAQVSDSIRDVMTLNGLSVLTGYQGGFGPRVTNNYEALNLISQAIDTTNLRLGYDVFLGIDATADNFYSKQQYHVRDKLSSLTAQQLSGFYKDLIQQFHILYIEDPMAIDDLEGWNIAYQQLDKDILLVGDTLVSGNPMRLETALEKQTITSIVIKPGYNATVLETLAFVEMCRTANLKLVVSNRSIETGDDFVADLAVAAHADYVTFGALNRGEHIAKYNRLLTINSLLSTTAV